MIWKGKPLVFILHLHIPLTKLLLSHNMMYLPPSSSFETTRIIFVMNLFFNVLNKFSCFISHFHLFSLLVNLCNSLAFSSSIFILSGPITTHKKSISLTFHLHFSGFTYKFFSSILFNISSTSLL